MSGDTVTLPEEVGSKEGVRLMRLPITGLDRGKLVDLAASQIYARMVTPLIERKTKEKPLEDDTKRELAQAAYEAAMALADFRADPR